MNNIVYILVLITVASCGLQKDIKRLQLQPITKTATFTIQPIPVKTLGTSYILDTTSYISKPNLYNLIVKDSILYTSAINITFNKDNVDLVFYMKDSIYKKVAIQGKWKRSGYFYIKRVEANIVIPIFYAKRILQKLWFGQDKDKHLVVMLNAINERNILLLGGGGTVYRYYYYKIM